MKCAVFVLAPLCFAQISSTVSLSNGVRVEVSSELGQPTGQETLTVEMSRASGDSFYRIFRDQNHLAVYAYELELTLSADGSALNATAKPATTEFAKRFADADAGKPVPTLSAVQSIGPLVSGRVGTLKLFEIPGVGLSVSEKVRVRIGAASGGGPLHFRDIRLLDGTRIAGDIAGRYLMYFVPGRGAFFFSTEAVAGKGFMKTGVADRGRLQFTINNVDYTVESQTPIYDGEVWVFHDPSYKPEGNWTQNPQNSAREQPFMAASDSLGWWLP